METNPEKEVIENLHTALKASQQEVVNLQKKLVQTQRKLDKSNGSYEELRKEVTCHFVWVECALDENVRDTSL